MAVNDAPEFTLLGVAKSFGGLRVLAGIDLAVPRDRILAILGPSGCGKTTLLRIIAGLVAPDGGELRGLAGKEVSLAFQEPRLLDWLTVEENIAFVLHRLPPGEARRRVEEGLARMRLAPYRAYYPRRLSGGQRQRAALARALAHPSRLLLLDEPFKSLDLGLKLELVADFLREWTAAPRTVILVTHDVQEALLLADEVAVLTEKPSTVSRRLAIDVPRGARRPDDPALLGMERELIASLLGRASR